MSATTKMIRVWDPAVRIGHWAIVIGFFTSYFTEDEFLTQHVWAGYLVGAVVVFRVLWGFIGPAHARFRSFVYSPRTILSYLKGLLTRDGQRYLGHSPAGGAMIIALLVGLAGTTYTGLELYAVEEGAGPLARWDSSDQDAGTFPSMVTSAYPDDDERRSRNRHGDNERDEEFWEELHEFFANFTLFLVFLHVGGVLLASYVHRENLVKSMFTGSKRP